MGTYGEAAELNKVGNLWRLSGPPSSKPTLSVGSSEGRGGRCGVGKTSDLVLAFEKEPTEWIQGVEDILKQSPADSPLCDVAMRPLDNARFEMRLSYRTPAQPKMAVLKTLSFETSNAFVVDHWFADGSPPPAPKPTAKGARTAGKSAAKDPLKPAITAAGISTYANKGTLIDLFDDESQWDRLLGNEAVAFDLNSPELNRFRYVEKGAPHQLSRDYVERQTLRLPFFELPSMDAAVAFVEDPLPFTGFVLHDLPASRKKDLSRDDRTSLESLVKGLNYLMSLVKEEEWLRAQKSMQILESSAQSKWLPKAGAKWSAVRGLIFLKLGLSLENKDYVNRGLDTWREGARAVAGGGGETNAIAEFMVVSLVRNLMTRDLSYPAAATLAWAKKFSWSAKIEERFAYLRAEAFYDLNLFTEARDEFKRFYQARQDKPLNASIDRRLVPAAAFRLGDIEFRQRKFGDAAREYSDAMQGVPTITKFSFEGNWYPDEIRIFPQVLFHRAESLLKQGYFQQALKDYRGFVFVAPNHPRIGNILYRIGDVLEYIDAPEEMVLSAWRECTFRVPGTLGAKLCEARKSAREMRETNKPERWPRLIGAMEEARPVPGEKFWAGLNSDDLETYAAMVMTDSFLSHSEAQQALYRIEPVLKLSPRPELAIWAQEYALTAYAGTQAQKLRDGQYKEIIQEYDSRKNNLLFRQTRAELLWYVAKAYQKLGLPEQSLTVLQEAERVRGVIARKEPRLFEPKEVEWVNFRAELEIKLYVPGKTDAKSVETALKRGDQNDPSLQRLWIAYAEKRDDVKLAAQWWKKLSEREFLPWPEVKRYSDALKKSNQNGERIEMLEKTVGVWLGEKDKGGKGNDPPAILLMDLAELRALQKTRHVGALSIYDHLLTVDSSKLSEGVTLAMVHFRRGELLATMGRNDDARRSFGEAKRLDPGGVWGQLAASSEKQLSPPTASKNPK